MKRTLLRSLRVAGLGLGVFSLLWVPSWAQTLCRAFDNHCATKMILTEYTDLPTVLCLVDHPVVQIDSKAACGFAGAGPVRVLRCGAIGIPFTYSGNGFTHTVGTSTNWENVLWGACEDVTYSAGPS